MKINRHLTLHAVLIILLILAPLRSVFAMQLMVCDMENMSMQDTAAVINSIDTDSSVAHLSSEATAEPAAYSGFSDTPQVQKDTANCCSDVNGCKSDCGMGMTVSFVVPASTFNPVYIDIAAMVSVSLDPIVRTLSPPSRPPLYLHS